MNSIKKEDVYIKRVTNMTSARTYVLVRKLITEFK